MSVVVINHKGHQGHEARMLFTIVPFVFFVVETFATHTSELPQHQMIHTQHLSHALAHRHAEPFAEFLHPVR